MRFFLVILLVLSIFFSCNTNEVSKVDISDITINYELKRYDVDFYTASEKKIPELKQKYPYLFPESFSDSIAISKINNKQEQELFSETQKIYKDINFLEKQLSNLFKHIKHYKSGFKAPNIITIQTNIDYESRVIYADSLLFISFDNYLGKSHPFYNDYPLYIKEENTKEHIIVDVAESILKTQLPLNNKRRFIDKMIHEGIKMYFLDTYLPEVSVHLKIGYTKDKLNWALENESQIWKYFIEKQLLFSTDTKLNKRFLDNAPFSKFYTSEDTTSPGKIGVWVGWQIVKSFMQNNDVSLRDLINFDSDELFKKSKYKPKKY